MYILWRKLEAAYEVFEAWVVVQGIEPRVNFEQTKNAFTVLISLIQFDKRLVILAERRVKACQIVRRQIGRSGFAGHCSQESLPTASSKTLTHQRSGLFSAD